MKSLSTADSAKAVGVAVIVAATAALAQLGLAFGLDILSWQELGSNGVVSESALNMRFSANLAWVAWFAAVSTVLGGMIGGRSADHPLWRLGCVLGAGLGAFVVGPLVALPATESVSSNFPMQPLAASAIGVAAGLVVALISLSSLAVAANVVASVVLVWFFAIMATFTDIGSPASPVTELAVWGSWMDPESALGRRGLSIALPFIVGSLIIGILVALAARGKSQTTSGYRVVAASGIAGPLLVTVAHVVGGPTATDNVEAMAVALVGPYAAIAGLLGSLLIAALPRSGGPIDDSLPASPAGTKASERTAADAEEQYWPPEGPTEAVETLPGSPADAPVPAQRSRAVEADSEPIFESPAPQSPPDFEPGAPEDADEAERWLSGLRESDSPAPEQTPADEPEEKPKRRKTRKKAAKKKKNTDPDS